MGYFSIRSNSVAAVAAAVFVVAVVQLQTAAFAKDQREFDYFVLALQWPGSACKNISYCCQDNGCCRGSQTPTQFTIHGLWPQYEVKGWPSCCTDESFNENEIFVLRKILPEIWPSYRCGSVTSCNNKKGSFWAEEYEKHGTCAAPVIEGQYNYFSTAIGLFNTHNVTKALENAGIVASDTVKYPLNDVMAAVEFAFGGTPKIMCGKKGIIKELYLCFDKKFKPRNCDETKSCPKKVKLPTIEQLESYMGEGAIPRMAEIAEAVI
ncbi:ribonuclease 2-like [Momordica charantia]|uniref:Ribonuclease 2-like n=1 Tax=Momordica charantia TaxID=3673 RepID=A0A6J1CHM7_MOMCH|nr:ribonuclease 2-like [Momordica charantia]